MCLALTGQSVPCSQCFTDCIYNEELLEVSCMEDLAPAGVKPAPQGPESWLSFSWDKHRDSEGLLYEL